MTERQHLGVQLYSVREHLGAELPDTLARLAADGFSHVEPYDIVSDPAGLARAIADAGLVASTAHAKITELGRDTVLPAAETVGIRTVIVPFVPPATFADRDSVLALADRINAEVEPAAAHGVRIGYHNHDFEFRPLPDGTPAYELLIAHLDERVVLELDTYWASVGGADVFELIPRLGARVPLLHVKNEPRRAGEEPPAGVDITGRMAEVIEAARPHLEMAVVEIVVDDAVLWGSLERNAVFFGAEVAA